ncbi:hypothetical protein J8273_5772 [Carpediemonas membranifera]|uniref:Uncharacterized protein n=1 Tax=Carpediemonas membranifera TaxID=201153 RepID=A0A8J6B2I1_9EUKA|nr:hypothetical protein J8273_5772 [Carpediemonas membranifera]|eukprot:KAG9392839.1 hypothetical protein J8273_5772 [Carpediemonas membranifera]
MGNGFGSHDRAGAPVGCDQVAKRADFLETSHKFDQTKTTMATDRSFDVESVEMRSLAGIVSVLREQLTVAEEQYADTPGLIPHHLFSAVMLLESQCSSVPPSPIQMTRSLAPKSVVEEMEGLMTGLHRLPAFPEQQSAIRLLTQAISYLKQPPRTINIDVPLDRLPDALYTLASPILSAVLLSSNASSDCWFLCKKTALMKTQYERGRRAIFKDGLETTVFAGRVYARGVNINGQTGIGSDAPFIPELTRVRRVPPLIDVFYGDTCVFGITATHKLYAWGANSFGQLGVGSNDGRISSPMRVRLPADSRPYLTNSSRHSTFIATNKGWFATGRNMLAQLGLGHRANVRIPQKIDFSGHMVSDVFTRYDTTFAWTTTGLVLACGWNEYGQAGVGGAADVIGRWARVQMPLVDQDGNGIETPFFPEHIYVSRCSTFFYAAHQVLCCGWNTVSQLPFQPSAEQTVAVPTPIPRSIDNLVCNAGSTVFLSDGELWGVGDNECGQLFPNGPYRIYNPRKLALPFPVARLLLCSSQLMGEVKGTMFVLSRAGEWWAQGYNNSGLCAVGSADYQIPLTRVRAPPGTRDIVSCTHATFMFTGDGLFACGDNDGNRLGLGRRGNVLDPMPVVDLTQELPTAFNWAVRDSQVLEMAVGEAAPVVDERM